MEIVYNKKIRFPIKIIFARSVLLLSFVILILTACANISSEKSTKAKMSIQKVDSEKVEDKNPEEFKKSSSYLGSERAKTENISELEKALIMNEVEKIHLQNITYLLEGNTKKLSEAFSYKDYVEFNDAFIKEKPVLNEDYFKRVITCELYQRYKNSKVEEVIYLNRKGIGVFNESEQYSPEIYFEKYKSWIKFMNGDVHIVFTPKDDSPFPVWSGFYRKENGEWKLIAGNFWISYYFDTLYKIK